MRARARVSATAAALVLALTVSLSGCLTVHGEQAVIPAVSEEEAERVLAEYTAVSNEANPAFDTALNLTIETGPLGAINQAGLRSRGTVHPEGNEQYQDLEFTDTRFLIPQQAGWPKFFVADSLSSRHGTNRWLLVFTRSRVDEDWRASYLSVLPADRVPEFSEDEDGFAEAVPREADSRRTVAPGDLSAAYTAHLQDQEGPFAESSYTSGEWEKRDSANNDPAYVTEFRDLPAEEEAYAPAALRTADGGALVFFGSHHHERKTMAEGEPLVVDQYVEALLESPAERTLTTVRMAMQVAHVPAAGDEGIALLNRISGAVSASGG
ncbi:hypothetical protein PJ985_09560 [Streptomyces sp. ACA25]|uniref:hypothetical protein n=1 Tax=Streptomyces sp. ACA25 TaxID=3022596 RepID=UPI00230806F8|nr:hypothetical protein [Streptomyces sp. ACA25]MDB1087809.1 hypothetical protein [Streptomyces sp. ACA25]